MAWGNFNLYPGVAVFLSCLIGIGVGPAAVKYLFTGERPRRKDVFEQCVNFLPEYRKQSVGYIPRTDPDEEWKRQHEQMGNLSLKEMYSRERE